MKQRDLFLPDPETTPDLFGEDRPPVLFRADPEDVRRDMHAVLAEARAAKVMPWKREILRYHQTVFPQMSRWLPPDEAAQLCFEFEREMKRLLAA